MLKYLVLDTDVWSATVSDAKTIASQHDAMASLGKTIASQHDAMTSLGKTIVSRDKTIASLDGTMTFLGSETASCALEIASRGCFVERLATKKQQ